MNDHQVILERLKPGTVRHRMYAILAAASRPLFAGEIARLIRHDHTAVADALRRLWNEGHLARSRPAGVVQSLWWTADRAEAMPPSTTPILARHDQPDEQLRQPVQIDVRAIAHNRCVWEWRP